MRRLAALIVLMVPLAACGDDDPDLNCVEPTEELAEGLPDIVCESEDDASDALEDAGFTMRVVRIDGEDLAVTADFVENRVNVAVETDGDTSFVVEIISLG